MTGSAPVTKRRAETRARLMAAAIEAIAERGVMAASVEDICERAGFTRGAFYSNFTDKDELVLALLDQQISAVIERTQQVIDDSLKAQQTEQTDSEELVERAAEAFGRANPLDRNSIVVQEELRLYAVRNPEMLEKFNAFEQQTLRSIRELLTNALEHVGREFTLPIDEAIAFLAAVEKQSSLDDLLTASATDGSARRTRPLTRLLLILTRPTS